MTGIRRTTALISFSFFVLCSSFFLAAAQSLPKPTGRVNDFANVIDAATEAEIDRELDGLEQRTSSEIAVATVSSLDGMSVEEYATRLFKEWGVGQAKQDNGVLVLASVTGGGHSAQAEAMRHGIARALSSEDPERRRALKRAGYLTRDDRKKERKKYGQAGARKRFQYSKR